MSENDKHLAETLQRAMPRATAEPSFAHTWEAAERRAGQGRRRLHVAAAAAVAAVALLVVVEFAAPPHDAHEYIEVAELLNSTSWTAPSDALLPARQVDVYRDVPELLESTDVYGGTLL